ncbi:helix-turn-helix transcriptional regulator [Hymenobacter sp. ASUV-10]|uniref:Helix-turn-helix transcriptional regulator n=1 Tax=Hymenobacter aranciens TaxID=3063996 RepID=A0ABT9BGB1_9BACT|nr:helix-turn-helix transcriptional regulator [Hymenobacter sp. ASUV-10]MDO7876072.1 helix-turn-helix transcriptional regulator [Hymenobacter sp. ASUV-10]
MVDRIRQLLQDKQLTPTQFADAIGIARPIVSHILSGRNKPSLEVVQKILAAFADLSIPWLLNGSEPMWTTAPIAAGAPAASVAPAAPMPPAPTEASATTQKAAENSLGNVVVPPAEETRPSEARRQPHRRPGGEPITNTAAYQTPLAAILPRPRRFQATAPGRTSPSTVAASPAGPQSSPEAIATSEPAAAPLPASAPLPAPAAPSGAPVPAVANDAAAAFLLQPGKAIRRIVIFYQDGSFADYQPEQ